MLKKLAIWVIAPLLFLIGGGFLVSFALVAMGEHEAILEFGKSVEGHNTHFTFIRLSIVIFIAFYWKEIVFWSSKKFQFNKRQRFFLNSMHPYLVGFMCVIEVLDLVL